MREERRQMDRIGSLETINHRVEPNKPFELVAAADAPEIDEQVLADTMRAHPFVPSELSVWDTIDAYPLLQGPEEFLASGATVELRAGTLLPTLEQAIEGCERGRAISQEIGTAFRSETYFVVPDGTVEAALTVSPDVSAVHRGYYSRYHYPAQMLDW